MHVLSTPPAFVLSQDQTLHECFPVIGRAPCKSGTTRSEYDRLFTASSLMLPTRSEDRAGLFKGTTNLRDAGARAEQPGRNMTGCSQRPR
ncbi:hypothetical protein EAO68_27515 [Streptomyces sp. wa22]|nr:hypothetical protein EAO68_27515 [Streptomyces sp. wa22]